MNRMQMDQRWGFDHHTREFRRFMRGQDRKFAERIREVYFPDSAPRKAPKRRIEPEVGVPAKGSGCNRPLASQTKEIIAQVCDEFGVSAAAVRGGDRAFRLSPARQKIAYRLRTESGLSYAQIGKYMERDHTTIVYYAREYRKAHGLEKDTFVQVADALPPAIAATIEAARRRQ